jgi:hypothetical protein
MNAKKYVGVAIVLSTVLLAVAACLKNNSSWAQGGANHPALTPSGKFGPVMEIVMFAEKDDKRTELLDFETARKLPQPAFFESLDTSAEAITAWIRTNGLDISCSIWSSAAACVTYDLTTIAVEGKCWKETTEEDILSDPALAPRMHSPRRQLVLGQNRPDTYIFRTDEGTLGILQIIGLTEDRSGVKIRYKLINPSGNEQTASASAANLLTAH